MGISVHLLFGELQTAPGGMKVFGFSDTDAS